MKKTTPVIFLFFLYACSGASQKQYAGFSVNSGIKKEVEEHLKTEGSVCMGGIKMKMYENDSLIFDGYKVKDPKFPLFTMINLKNDTIHITAFCGFTAAFGFYVDLFNDQSDITYLEHTDALVYKLNKEDTTLQFNVSVSCTKQKLILVEKPHYKYGEVVEGKIELSSKDYYAKSNGEEKRLRVELTAWFKTAPLKKEFEEKSNSTTVDTSVFKF